MILKFESLVLFESVESLNPRTKIVNMAPKMEIYAAEVSSVIPVVEEEPIILLGGIIPVGGFPVEYTESEELQLLLAALDGDSTLEEEVISQEVAEILVESDEEDLIFIPMDEDLVHAIQQGEHINIEVLDISSEGEEEEIEFIFVSDDDDDLSEGDFSDDTSNALLNGVIEEE